MEVMRTIVFSEPDAAMLERGIRLGFLRADTPGVPPPFVLAEDRAQYQRLKMESVKGKGMDKG